jgi:hypothetical protein
MIFRWTVVPLSMAGIDTSERVSFLGRKKRQTGDVIAPELESEPALFTVLLSDLVRWTHDSLDQGLCEQEDCSRIKHLKRCYMLAHVLMHS